MKLFGLAIFMLAGIACAQLVQKKAPTAADSIDLGNKKGPIVYSDPKENEKSANRELYRGPAQGLEHWRPKGTAFCGGH